MTIDQIKKLSRVQALEKFEELKEGRTDFAKDFNQQYFKAQNSGHIKDPAFDTWQALSAVAFAPETDSERAAKVRTNQCPFTAQQIREARVQIENMKSSPQFQKAFWDSNEIGNRQAVESWNASFEIAHAEGAEKVLES